MGIKSSDFKEIFAKLSRFEISHREINDLVTYIKERLHPKLDRCGLSDVEKDCLIFLLNYSTNVPMLFAEHLEQKRLRVASEKIMTAAGDRKKRLEELRKLHGLSSRKIKKAEVLKMKNLYAMLYLKEIKPDEAGKFFFQWYDDGIEYRLIWRTEAEKKHAIIDALADISGRSHNAVIKALRDVGTENLPAQKGSGMSHPSTKINSSKPRRV